MKKDRKISKAMVNRLRNHLGNVCSANDECVDNGIYNEDDANALEELNILLVMLLNGDKLEVDKSLEDEKPIYYEKMNDDDY